MKKWGEGASMIRGEWRQRDSDKTDTMNDDIRDGRQGNSNEQAEMREGDSRSRTRADAEMYDVTESDPEDRVYQEEEEDEETEIQEDESPYTNGTATPQASQRADVDVNELAHSMTSLSLVPSSVRFGRGGSKNAGFLAHHHTKLADAPNQHHANGRGTGIAHRPGRGRGIRGTRGFRGGGVVAQDTAPAHSSAGGPVRGTSRGGLLHVARGTIPNARGLLGVRGRPPVVRGGSGWIPRGRGRDSAM